MSKSDSWSWSKFRSDRFCSKVTALGMLDPVPAAHVISVAILQSRLDIRRIRRMHSAFASERSIAASCLLMSLPHYHVLYHISGTPP
jgi:hypothetical protein